VSEGGKMGGWVSEGILCFMRESTRDAVLSE
jgi:hypothetical protein